MIINSLTKLGERSFNPLLCGKGHRRWMNKILKNLQKYKRKWLSLGHEVTGRNEVLSLWNNKREKSCVAKRQVTGCCGSTQKEQLRWSVKKTVWKDRNPFTSFIYADNTATPQEYHKNWNKTQETISLVMMLDFFFSIPLWNELVVM